VVPGATFAWWPGAYTIAMALLLQLLDVDGKIVNHHCAIEIERNLKQLQKIQNMFISLPKRIHD
jgi:hypothetical protein